LLIEINIKYTVCCCCCREAEQERRREEEREEEEGRGWYHNIRQNINSSSM
jgi:hypothetical protein